MQGQGLRLTRSNVHIVRSLGGGGAGNLYLAKLVGINGFSKEVVLKQAREGLPEYEQCLVDEAHLLGKLQHPRIIAALDHGVRELEGGITVPYLMLEYGGVSLGAVQRACGGRIEPGLATYIALEVLSALAFAHANDIVHRDVKPGNVLIGQHGEVKLIDFGIAKSDALRRATTEAALVKGTISYVAPEMVKRAKLDGRADLWAVGVMLYEMLTGKPPWVPQADSTSEYRVDLAKQILTEPPPPLPQEQVPEALSAVIYRLLAKNRDDRYANAEEAMQALLAVGAPLAKQIAEAELGHHAQAAELPLSRNSSPKSSSLTVPVQADRRTPPGLVPFKLPAGSIELSMSSSETSLTLGSDDWWADSSTNAAPHQTKGQRDLDTTDVVPAIKAATTPAKRRIPRKATAAAVLVAVLTGGIFALRDTREAQAESTTPKAQHPVMTNTRPPQGPTPTASPDRLPAAPVAPASEPAPKPPDPPARNVERSPSAGKASLSVVVVPAGGYVSLDGRSAVHAPFQFSNLRAGEHLLRAGRERGRLTQVQRIKLSEGLNAVRLELANQPAGPNPFEE